MRFRFIDAERAGLAMPIFRLCRLLQVSVSKLLRLAQSRPKPATAR